MCRYWAEIKVDELTEGECEARRTQGRKRTKLEDIERAGCKSSFGICPPLRPTAVVGNGSVTHLLTIMQTKEQLNLLLHYFLSRVFSPADYETGWCPAGLRRIGMEALGLREIV